MIQNDQRGGFLIRTRRFFLEDGFLTVVVDAPSDQQPLFHQSFRETPRSGEETKTPLVTVTGVGDRRGKPCMAFTEHGFVGMEAKTIKAILSWIRTGVVPADVSE